VDLYILKGEAKMTQEPRQPINLSVHETSDPNVISRNPDLEASREMNDSNDSVNDFENFDFPSSGPSDDSKSENIMARQNTIANIGGQ